MSESTPNEATTPATPESNPAPKSSASPKATPSKKQHRGRNTAVFAAIGILAASALGLTAAIDYFQLYLKKAPIYPESGLQVSAIPTETASWQRVGPDRRENAEVEEVLGTTNYVSRVYIQKNPANPEKPVALDFHAAYYTGMIDTVPHVPDRCFVGGGLQIGEIEGDLPLDLNKDDRWVAVDDVPEHLRGQIFRAPLSYEYSDQPGTFVTLPRNPQDIRLRTMKFVDSGGKALYSGYFFVANGGTVSRAEGVRLLAFDLSSYYAYYLKVQVTSTTVESGDELAAAASSLLDELLPELMRCVPDWVRVEQGLYPADNPIAAKKAND